MQARGSCGLCEKVSDALLFSFEFPRRAGLSSFLAPRYASKIHQASIAIGNTVRGISRHGRPYVLL